MIVKDAALFLLFLLICLFGSSRSTCNPFTVGATLSTCSMVPYYQLDAESTALTMSATLNDCQRTYTDIMVNVAGPFSINSGGFFEYDVWWDTTNSLCAVQMQYYDSSFSTWIDSRNSVDEKGYVSTPSTVSSNIYNEVANY